MSIENIDRHLTTDSSSTHDPYFVESSDCYRYLECSVSQSVQDVRTCFIYFCLSFLMFGDLAVMKQILELKGSLHSLYRYMYGLSCSECMLKQRSKIKCMLMYIVYSTGQR